MRENDEKELGQDSGEKDPVFLAKGLEYKGIGKRDETEEIEILKISINELYDRLSDLRSEGNLIDLKIYGLVELAKRHL